MKYTREELSDFIKEIKNNCRSTMDCRNCPCYSGFKCSLCSRPDKWAELKPEKKIVLEPGRKIVPFDFSLKEDRDALIGKRIISTCSDFIVNGFAFWPKQGWMLQLDSEFGYSSDYVFENFVFAYTGKPAGKEVTE